MSVADPPLIVGELAGLRVWPLEYGRLRAAGWDVTWPDGGGAMTATCQVGAQHEAPAADCSCGIYAWHPRPSSAEEVFSECSRGGNFVAGIVAAWGAIEVHRTGFRAQYARPVAFVVERRRAGPGYRRRVRRLAARHHAQVLLVDSPLDLYEHCLAHGLGLRESAVEELLVVRRQAERARRRKRLRAQRAGVAVAASAAALGATLTVPGL